MKHWGVATGLTLLCASLSGAEFTLDVRNGACERTNAVVSRTVTREQYEAAHAATGIDEAERAELTPAAFGFS